MKLNKLIDWLQVVANVGILIGLILVLFQMKQNEDLLRVEIVNQYHDSYASYESMFAGENLPAIWEKSVLDAENLTFAEMRALEAVTFVPLIRWINLYKQSEVGVLEDFDWEAEVINDAMYYFNTPYGRAWWEHLAKGMYEEGFLPSAIYEIVEARLNDPQELEWIENYKAIRQIVKDNKKKE